MAEHHPGRVGARSVAVILEVSQAGALAVHSSLVHGAIPEGRELRYRSCT